MSSHYPDYLEIAERMYGGALPAALKDRLDRIAEMVERDTENAATLRSRQIIALCVDDQKQAEEVRR